jgi:hypothetical protein
VQQAGIRRGAVWRRLDGRALDARGIEKQIAASRTIACTRDGIAGAGVTVITQKPHPAVLCRVLPKGGHEFPHCGRFFSLLVAMNLPTTRWPLTAP